MSQNSPNKNYADCLKIFDDGHLAAITKAGQLCGAEMIPVSDLFCDAEICSSWQEGIHLYRDDDHLSQDGARFVAPRFEAAMAR